MGREYKERRQAVEQPLVELRVLVARVDGLSDDLYELGVSRKELRTAYRLVRQAYNSLVGAEVNIKDYITPDWP